MATIQDKSPINAIPTEIWEKIFFHATTPLDRNTNIRNGPKPDALSHIAPCLSLSQTCAGWRDIVLSRPLLWSKVVVQLQHNNQTPNQHLVQLMIERSANAPLSIDLLLIYVDENSFTDPTSANSCYMDVLFRSISRWHRLRVFLHGCSLPPPITEQLMATGSPSLECLQIDAELQFPTEDELLSALWERSPRLHKILLSYCNYTVWLPPVPNLRQIPSTIPYRQITSLCIHISLPPGTLSTISASMAVWVLHESPNLVSCILSNLFSRPQSSITTMEKSVEMAHLEYLHLAAAEKDKDQELPLTVILDHIRAPHLKTIAFTNIRLWGQDDFELFIDRSRCSLVEINFFNTHDLGAGTIIPILQILPSLEGVHLGCLQDLLKEPAFVAEMMAWNASLEEFDLCPNLSWLSFQDPTCFDIEPNCDIDASEIENLGQILKKRLHPPNACKRGIECLYIPSGKITADLYHCIQTLCNDPYVLDIQEQEEDRYDIYDLWERYGNK